MGPRLTRLAWACARRLSPGLSLALGLVAWAWACTRRLSLRLRVSMSLPPSPLVVMGLASGLGLGCYMWLSGSCQLGTWANSLQ